MALFRCIKSHHLDKLNLLHQICSRSLTNTVADDIQYDYDTMIVGGGIVGLSTARLLQLKYPSMKIGLLEKESSLSQHQTGHNSGVIHCGIYYKPNSLKATLCVKGNQQIYDYCKEKNIKHLRGGKLIVAVDPSEIPRLHTLYENGLKNKVPGLQLLQNPADIKQIEPLCDGGLEAIWCDTTGIVNFAQVANEFANDFTDNGGTIMTSQQVINFTSINKIMSKDFMNGITVQTKDPSKDMNDMSNISYLKCKHVITCCGVYSDRISEMSGQSKYPYMVPIRGDYLKIKNKGLNQRFTGVNIYPVPNPKFPALGVHFTPMFNRDGTDEIEYILGPTAVFAYGRESYWFTKNINVTDTLETITKIGFWKMVKQHWRHGLNELYKDILYKRQVDELKRYVSELGYDDVERSFSGIRGQTMDVNGNLTDDFCIDTQCPDAFNGNGRFLNVRNAPSPACTSSIAIGEMIVDQATKTFKLDRFLSKQY